jgi:hypothetical protein
LLENPKSLFIEIVFLMEKIFCPNHQIRCWSEKMTVGEVRRKHQAKKIGRCGGLYSIHALFTGWDLHTDVKKF